VAQNMEDEALSGVAQWGRIVLVALLLYWTWVFLWTPLSPDSGDSFLHLPNLIFHEAGHVIFAPLGHFLSVLGGSLMQCLVPAIAAVAFVRQAQPFAAAVCVWWAGQNLTDLAPYIADARALRLTLLGGRTGAEVEGHDWEYLLNALGVSHLDRTIGTVTHAAGILIMVAALAYMAKTLLRKSE
jgi:hypothetical protein